MWASKLEDSGWVEICRILAGSAPKLDHFRVAVAERAGKLFSQGLQKNLLSVFLSVAMQPFAACYWPVQAARWPMAMD